MRERDEQPWTHLAQYLAGSRFVRRVSVRVQEAHRYRTDTLIDHLAAYLAHRLFIKRYQHVALGVQPFPCLKAQMPWHQRLRALESDVEGIGPVAARDLVNVAKTLGGEQRGLVALALEHRVDGNRRAMQELVEILHARVR